MKFSSFDTKNTIDTIDAYTLETPESKRASEFKSSHVSKMPLVRVRGDDKNVPLARANVWHAFCASRARIAESEWWFFRSTVIWEICRKDLPDNRCEWAINEKEIFVEIAFITYIPVLRIFMYNGKAERTIFLPIRENSGTDTSPLGRVKVDTWHILGLVIY